MWLPSLQTMVVCGGSFLSSHVCYTGGGGACELLGAGGGGAAMGMGVCSFVALTGGLFNALKIRKKRRK